MNRFHIMLSALALFAVLCQQDNTATDFYEKMPGERVSKIVRDLPKSRSRRAVAGIGYGAGYTSGVSSSFSDNSTGHPPSKTAVEQMLIKKASLRFEVKDYPTARNAITQIVDGFEAYISSERESKTDYQVSNQIAIRVVSSQFEPLVDSLIGQAKNIDEKNITVEDVTEEFVDVKARLKAKRQVESRYLEILKKANSVKDILEVEQKLGEVREGIETSEGRLKYLSHQVAYSTVNLHFYEQKSVFPKARVGFLSRLATSFLNGWTGLTEFALGLISIWPFLLIMCGLVFLITKFMKRMKKRRSAPDFENMEE